MKKVLMFTLLLALALPATAQWTDRGNAKRIQNIPVDVPSAADDGQCLVYNNSSLAIQWTTIGSGAITNGTEGQVLRSGASTPAWASAIAVGISPVTVAATGNLTAAQVNGSLITNYGQGAAATLTLPTAASGYNFIVVVSTTGNALHIKAGASDKLYLDGTALDDGDKASLATPALGNTLTCFTFQTGASAYDWICTSGGGSAWTDGGA